MTAVMREGYLTASGLTGIVGAGEHLDVGFVATSLEDRGCGDVGRVDCGRRDSFGEDERLRLREGGRGPCQ